MDHRIKELKRRIADLYNTGYKDDAIVSKDIAINDLEYSYLTANCNVYRVVINTNHIRSLINSSSKLIKLLDTSNKIIRNKEDWSIIKSECKFKNKDLVYFKDTALEIDIELRFEDYEEKWFLDTTYYGGLYRGIYGKLIKK